MNLRENIRKKFTNKTASTLLKTSPTEMHKIKIYVPTRDEPFIFEYGDLVEDYIIKTCQQLKIGPLARYFFALQSLPSCTWLNASHKLLETGGKNGENEYRLRFRFNVPDLDELFQLDRKAHDFYFRQAREGILSNSIPGLDYEKHTSEINGLSVIDMFRAVVEENLNRNDVVRDYRKYLPQQAIKKHLFFLRKPIVEKLNDIRMSNRVDPYFVKSGYLEQFQRIAPNYLTEEYDACIRRNGIGGTLDAIKIRVNPFDPKTPGISMRQIHKETWEHICTIDDLCFISVSQKGGTMEITMEISRKNGTPVSFEFGLMTTVRSFVTLLDGYYRLMVKWTFNLCNIYQTPSLTRLLSWRCHGPINGVFAYQKLREKRNNKPGCFIMRESDLHYDTYYIDVCVSPQLSSNPITYKIEKTPSGRYKIEGHDREADSPWALLKSYRSGVNELSLVELLPPSENDKSNLLLCLDKHTECNKLSNTEESARSTRPVCIDPTSLRVFKNMPREGSSPYTTVYRSQWLDKTKKPYVAIKVLKENFLQRYLADFNSLINRWAFVDAGSVVKLLGVTLSRPVSMVMEYLPLGQLDLYLADPANRNQIKEVTLVEAATSLANALYYLGEANFVHGNIRCRKLLVAEHTDNSFIVKLSDPGFNHSYKDIDYHWIPPEYHSNPNAARESITADVWAYGTTLWEIFSYGKLPFNGDAATIKEYYNEPHKHLSLPPGCPSNIFHLMKDCWNYDPYARKKPQAVMRDISQLFYQVFNSRNKNAYSTVSPSKYSSTDQDSVSNKSKTSDDFSSSIRSETTLNTVLDDADELCSLSEQTSIELSTTDTSVGTDIPYQINTTYFCITDKREILAAVDQQDSGGGSISSMQSIFELDKEWNLVLNGRIGEGFYGEVYRGRLLHMYEDKEQQVAVKKMKAEAMDQTNLADFDREIKTMLKLEHKNIVGIKGIVQDPELCLVLEYVEHGSLQCYLTIHKDRLTSRHLMKYATDVAQGMAYLSQVRLVHRDLAARNILVVNEFNVKISDFGLARFIGNGNYYVFRTERDLPIKWYAPESIEYGKFSPQSDVWSYGVTLYEMFSYGADPRLPNVEQKPEEIVKALKNNIRLPMPPQCPQFVYTNLLVPCWAFEVNERPSFEKLVKIIEDITCKSKYV